ncbi:aminopeptidase P family protein [Dissulfurirhabdus thermomarina]|uniref:Aminopeptidase P family protein n=1 Tax=Dissulfurirhabdus thermomarina TaxID=1765737 RepID=A0A6N9TQI2_DISTH|nr:Xaa-Pro peptidase family protein [Dissulfurirhabdus thermomarina]NDY43531.1 aminopeptidase P family protein [Dissulfurirhabdus thermomarina]NMX23718.1 aminopeptidase P family protein [Dissulfurirhabdus thermomarina]
MSADARVPAAEARDRIRRFQERLRHEGVELALVRQNADLAYLAGTVQDAHLLVPARGTPLFLVRRCLDRARRESPLERIAPLAGLSRLPGILRNEGWDDVRTLGLEMDVLPARLYLHYSREVWPEAEVRDVTPLLRELRAVKSPWEVDCIRGAAAQAAEAVAAVPGVLRPGMTELELAAEVEARLRRRGHPGFFRMRGWNQEIGMGQILSGPAGAVPAWTQTPAGGEGPGPAFGQGASFRRIGRNEPVSVDIGGWDRGYLCDQTRMFVAGRLPRDLRAAFEAVRRLLEDLAARLRPGAVCGDLYRLAVETMEAAGLGDHFMGSGAERVPFVGHGLGLEVDELPLLCRDNPARLAPGMVVAVEPKLIFPGRGLVGLEDTFLVTETGAEVLTTAPREVIEV